MLPVSDYNQFIENNQDQTLCTLFETSHHQLDSVPPLRLIQPLMCVQGNLIEDVIEQQTSLQVGEHDITLLLSLSART